MKPGKIIDRSKLSFAKRARLTVGEMIAGKTPEATNAIAKRILGGFYNMGPSVDYVRNDYELFRSVYYASLQTNRAKPFLLGASFAAPIIDAVAGFALAAGFKVKVESKGVSPEQAEQASNRTNDWTEDNDSLIFDAFTHSLRDGDTYLYVDELANLDEMDAGAVEVILDPVSGDVVGFDVTEKMRVEMNSGIFDQQTILRQYRLDSIVYTRFTNNKQQNGEVIYKAIFTEDGVITDLDTETKMFAEADFLRRPLPLIHFANNKEPRAIYGNSELQNVLLNMKQYATVLDSGTAGVIYNSNPIPYATGNVNLKNAQGQTVAWDRSTMLAGDKDAKFGFLQAKGIMDDVKSLLEIYFYLIVQASQTPEFLFGTAVSSSKASTQSQMPIMIQKAQRKRKKLKAPLKQLVQAYVDRMIYLSDPDFLPFKNKEVTVKIIYPDIVDEDKKLNLEIVKFLLENGLISNEMAVEIAAMRFIDDIPAEVKKGQAQAAATNRRNAVIDDDEEALRLQRELEDEE